MDVRVAMRQAPDGTWSARATAPVDAAADGPDPDGCLAALRAAVEEASGEDAAGITFLVETVPQLAGVAEAAAVLGWDKRRVITYIDRGSFPAPIQALASGRVWLRRDVEAFAEEWRARYLARQRTPSRTRSRTPSGTASRAAPKEP